MLLLLIDCCSQNPFLRTCPRGWATEQGRIWVSQEGGGSLGAKGHLARNLLFERREFYTACLCWLLLLLSFATTEGQTPLFVWAVGRARSNLWCLCCTSAFNTRPLNASIWAKWVHGIVAPQYPTNVFASFSSICNYSWECSLAV